MNPILLGESPSESGDRYRDFPLSGRPARVLCGLAEIPPQSEGSTYGRWTWALYDLFECRNLFYRHREATPWSVPAARSRAAALLPDLAGRVVVCLGKRPLTAVLGALAEVREMPRFEARFHDWGMGAFPDQPAALSGIPHPSGLNRALNDAEERDRAGATLRKDSFVFIWLAWAAIKFPGATHWGLFKGNFVGKLEMIAIGVALTAARRFVFPVAKPA